MVWARAATAVLLAVLLPWVAAQEWTGGIRIGPLLDPVDGLYRTARNTDRPLSGMEIESLDGSGRVVFDDRGVPHIFAESDADAVRVFGYVTARDRLFQMDFLRRVAEGRLSEWFGPGSVATDRFLRRTGMADGARRSWEAAEGREDRIAMEWFAEGVNAYLRDLKPVDLPFEYRLFGIDAVEPFRSVDGFLIGSNLVFDLSYAREEALAYDRSRQAMTSASYDSLFPRFTRLAPPIVSGRWAGALATGSARPEGLGAGGPGQKLRPVLERTPLPAYAAGFFPGKGSNNWAVSALRSTTGAPILAGDMHLGLTLPAIWYEAHLVTPTMNTYGVTVPGVPVPIEAFNDDLGWAFTNTGSDQIDHMLLALDSTGTRYRYESAWRPLTFVPDTIQVRGAEAVPDTLVYAHWGPVRFDEAGRAVAEKWVGHEPTGTLWAIWEMNHARNRSEFEAAVRRWTSPMQNILYADRGGHIAIRSTGRLPIRADGDGHGLQPGWSADSEWIGNVPFDELPAAVDPARGYLTSTNQQPADATYPYYLGRDWREIYRSMRIDKLLRDRDRHSVDDIRGYQSDVHAVQRDLFVPLLEPLKELSTAGELLRRQLLAWDGDTSVERREPAGFDRYLRALRRLTWDEPELTGGRRPSDEVLFFMLSEEPNSRWLDRTDTPEREHALDVLRAALEGAATVETTAPWGSEHGLTLRHITRAEPLRTLGRGPIPFPGYNATLSPGNGRNVTFGASWRVVIDWSQDPPKAQGIYPGGASGNPLSRFYDLHVDDFVHFRYYDLLTPSTPAQIPGERLLHEVGFGASTR